MKHRRSYQSRPFTKGLAATFCLPLFVIAGCDSGSKTTDKAVVVVQDPAALSSGKPVVNSSTSTSGTLTAANTENAAKAETPTAATAGGWATLKGRVVFEGTPSAPKILVPKGGEKDTKDAAYCAKNEIDSERLVVSEKTKGVKNILVYIPKPTAVNPEAASAAKSAEVDFDQKNCRFVPHVLAAMKGATVTLKSDDSVGHNTNSSGGLNNNKFNLPTQPHSSMPVLLRGTDKPGKITCDIHNWMEAYWLVLDNPYYAVTDADGNFEIKNVPTGEQKVVVWAEALGPGYLTAASGEPVNIKADGTTKDFTLDASKVK